MFRQVSSTSSTGWPFTEQAQEGLSGTMKCSISPRPFLMTISSRGLEYKETSKIRSWKWQQTERVVGSHFKPDQKYLAPPTGGTLYSRRPRQLKCPFLSSQPVGPPPSSPPSTSTVPDPTLAAMPAPQPVADHPNRIPPARLAVRVCVCV